jgi:hypothetical protein
MPNSSRPATNNAASTRGTAVHWTYHGQFDCQARRRQRERPTNHTVFSHFAQLRGDEHVRVHDRAMYFFRVVIALSCKRYTRTVCRTVVPVLRLLPPERINARGCAAGKKSYEAWSNTCRSPDFGRPLSSFPTYISTSYGYDPGGIAVAL